MSGYHSCILPTESPPSLDISDEKQDIIELFSSAPVTPISPLEPNDFENKLKFTNNLGSTESTSNNQIDSNISQRCISVLENVERRNRKDMLSCPEDSNINFGTDDNTENILSNNLDLLTYKGNVERCIEPCNSNGDNVKNATSNGNECLDNKNCSITIELLEKCASKIDQSDKHEVASKIVSTLTLTEDHPLMILSSPDSPPYQNSHLNKNINNDRNENKLYINDTAHLPYSDCSGMVSLSSTEDESFNRSLANGDINSLYSESFPLNCEPQRNTSKNNLFFSENFIGSDCSKSIEEYCTKEDLDKVKSVSGCQSLSSSQSNEQDNINKQSIITDNCIMIPELLPKNQRKTINLHNTIAKNQTDHNVNIKSYNFKSNLSLLHLETQKTLENEDLPSPDSSSTSKPDERSLYHAEVDPFGGCVTLKPKSSKPINVLKKKMKPLIDESLSASSDSVIPVACQNEISESASSLESFSDYSLHSDDDVESPMKKCDLKYLQYKKKYMGSSDGETGIVRSNAQMTEVQNSPERIPEYSLSEERRDTRLWQKVTLPTGEQRTIDMKVIEPYKRVLSHGGYALSGRRDAIVVFSACYLPDSSRVDYNYVMDNLFLYVLTTLEQLVTDDYILIYLHGSASKRSMPTFHWLKKCYQLIDRRLRKSLKHLYLVHPTFWLKSIMWMTKPFISSKFSRKLSYVYNLDELENLVPVEQAAIPEKVRRYDSTRT